MDDFSNIISGAFGFLYKEEVATFAVASMFIAAFIWLLDLFTTLFSGKSMLLGVGTGGVRNIQSLVLWGVGAGVAAYIGGLAGLFNLESKNAMLAVGIGWPTVLPRLIALSEEAATKSKSAIEEPEQQEYNDLEEEEIK